MERTERLLDILGEIDPELIAAVDLLPTATRRTPRRKWLPAVACLCLCALLGLTAWRVVPMIAPGVSDESSHGTGTDYPDAQDIAVTEPEGSKTSAEAGGLLHDTTGELFNHFTAGDRTYAVANGEKSISPLLLGELLGHATAEHRHPSNNSTLPISYYRIHGIDDALAVAVIFEGEETIYVYRNENYRPATLGALIEASSLLQFMTLDDVTEERAVEGKLVTTVYRAHTALTEEYLFRPLWDTAPVRAYSNSTLLAPAKSPILLSVAGEISELGDPYWEAEISQNGYLVFPLLGNYYIFPIEESVLDGYLTALAQKTAHSTETEPIPLQRGGNLRGITNAASIYHKLTIDGAAYQCQTCRYGIDAARVGDQLGQVKAGAAQAAPIATYYRLEGIAPEVGIAVRFPDEETYYSYFSTDYRPETLGDLIADLGLDTYLQATGSVICYREATITQTATFARTDTALLRRHILTDTAAPNIATENTKKPKVGTYMLDLSLQLPLFSGSADYTLRISEDGLLYVDLLGIRCLFDIGFDREDLARLAMDMILRDTDFDLQVTDTVTPPAGERDFDKAPDHVRYSGLEWDGLAYATAHAPVTPETVGRELGTAVAVGLHRETRMLFHTDVTLYAVDGYDIHHAVAARFEDAEDCYLYIINGYVGQNLQTVMTTYGLRENGTLLDFRSTVYGVNPGSTIFSTGYANDPLDIVFPTVDPARAWELLFGNPYAPRTDTTKYPLFMQKHHSTLSFTLRCPTLEGGEVEMILDRGGYLCFRFASQQCLVYHIGQERAAAFLEYVLACCAEAHEIREGAIVLREGETRLGVITAQLTRRFGLTVTAP